VPQQDPEAYIHPDSAGKDAYDFLSTGPSPSSVPAKRNIERFIHDIYGSGLPNPDQAVYVYHVPDLICYPHRVKTRLHSESIAIEARGMLLRTIALSMFFPLMSV